MVSPELAKRKQILHSLPDKEFMYLPETREADEEEIISSQLLDNLQAQTLVVH
jgi:hypothetical protein